MFDINKAVQECEICFEIKPFKNFKIFSCEDHVACKKCFKNHCTSSFELFFVKIVGDIYSIKCPFCTYRYMHLAEN